MQGDLLKHNLIWSHGRSHLNCTNFDHDYWWQLLSTYRPQWLWWWSWLMPFALLISILFLEILMRDFKTVTKFLKEYLPIIDFRYFLTKSIFCFSFLFSKFKCTSEGWFVFFNWMQEVAVNLVVVTIIQVPSMQFFSFLMRAFLQSIPHFLIAYLSLFHILHVIMFFLRSWDYLMSRYVLRFSIYLFFSFFFILKDMDFKCVN